MLFRRKVISCITAEKGPTAIAAVLRHCCPSLGAFWPETLTAMRWNFLYQEIAMATLNHTNLTTYDVSALKEFFCWAFGFQVLDERGDKLAVLRNSDGFLLTLMYDKRMTPEQGYPGLFHVGFLQQTQSDVDLMHEALSARNYMAPKPAKLQRGGPAAYGFYCEAPGGVLVEVSTMSIAKSA
jgi:catechol 2,3-dioxygenase-like lactoylglutathione lyase family enzyme